MTRTIKAIVPLGEATHATSRYKSLTALALCLGMGLAAPTQAQEPTNHGWAPSATEAADGWWSAEAAATAPTPHLLINLASLPHPWSSDHAEASAVQTDGYGLIDSSINTAVLSGFGLSRSAQTKGVGAVGADDALARESVFSRIEASYAGWESSLSDSRSLTDVNGMSVYPYVQFNHAGAHLPIAMYISPPRGSDAR